MAQDYIGDLHIEEFLNRAEREFPNDFDIIREIKERLDDLKNLEEGE